MLRHIYETEATTVRDKMARAIFERCDAEMFACEEAADAILALPEFSALREIRPRMVDDYLARDGYSDLADDLLAALTPFGTEDEE